MFKRLFWLTVGMAIGFGTSFWLFRLVRDTIARYTPEQMADSAGQLLRRVGADVRSAVAEGHEAMVQAEADLRSEIQPR